MHGEYIEYKQLLKERLNDKRYYHSLCVADAAYDLAKKLGCDSEKAYLSGLLHDITKNSDKETHFEIFEKHRIKLNEIELNAEKLWHAISGSAFVKYELGITDDEIFDAIRYHTTAKENMPLLTQIVYIADFISADRDFDDVEILRGIVNKSFSDGLKYALAYTVKDLVDRELAIHLDTVAAYNEYIR